MIKKLAKIFVILVLLAVIISLGITTFVRAVLTREKIKSVIETEFKYKFNREIKIDSMEISYFNFSPYATIKLNKIQIFEKQKYSIGIFIAAERLNVFISLFPLLRGAIIIDEIGLVKPDISIIRYNDEEFKLEYLFRKSKQQPKKINLWATDFAITRFYIDSGNLKYVDWRNNKLYLDFSDINININNIKLTEPLKLKLLCKLQSDYIKIDEKSDIFLNGTYDLLQNILLLRNFDITTKFGNILCSGNIINVTKKPVFEINLKTQVSDLGKIISDLSIPVKGIKLSGKPSLELDFKGTFDTFRSTGTLDLTYSHLEYQKMFNKQENIDGRVDIDLMGRFELEKKYVDVRLITVFSKELCNMFKDDAKLFLLDKEGKIKLTTYITGNIDKPQYKLGFK